MAGFEATEHAVDVFGISETDLPSLLTPTISYAHYSGTQLAKDTIQLLLAVMRTKTPASEKSITISWEQSKA